MHRALRLALRGGASRSFAVAPTATRSLCLSTPALAKVSPPLPFSWSHLNNDDAKRASSSSDPSQSAGEAALPKDHRALLSLKKERKLKEYEAKIKVKAMQEGLSLEEFKQKSIAQSKARSMHPSSSTSTSIPSSAAKDSPPSPNSTTDGASEVEKKDAKVAAQIRARSEAEAKRKLESGLLNSTPAGGQEGPVKPLSKILDVEKLQTQDTETVSKLWTGYHIMKNKLCAVVPAEKYAEMLQNAKKYPQFVLPLPRKVVGAEQDLPGSSDTTSEAFEMNFLEWAILPPSSPSFNAGTSASNAQLRPATTLFTPLAEYKLKQDFSQPVLILTFYPDLADSHNIVLMRGEITGLNEQTGKGGRIDHKEAQLLSLTLQRFYLPTPTQDGEQCKQLLQNFHEKPQDFDVEELVNVAFRL
ncbi:ATP11-domain-containing protein [Testicularia cyperi]|uniref:ATP11-domain-containing protein n=1 Tax=Testicularia cyperi TaxID=1882483 RepID=A0A317Y2F2_9BASI|nr:ATP11-domain-containing protein [Testicularia cyperi]